MYYAQLQAVPPFAFTHRETDRVYGLSDQSVNSTARLVSLFLFSSCPSSRSPVWCRRLSIAGKAASNSCPYPSFFCVRSQARGPISVRLKPQLLPQLHTSCWLPSSACNRSFAFSFLQPPPRPPKPVAYGEPLQSAAPGLPPLDICGGISNKRGL